MRVTHLISGDLWAGAEAATFHLVTQLAARGDLEVSAVLLNEGQLAVRLRAAGVETAIEPEAGRRFTALARAVRRRLAGADLVHAHRIKENLLAALSGRPWLTTQHGAPEPFSGLAAVRMRAYQSIDRVLRRFSARRVVAVSRELAERLAHEVGPERCAMIWNGIADPASAVAPVPYAERPMRVGTLGRLYPVKDYGLAIDAVAACPGLELEIVGDGPERARLERRVAQLDVADRVRLVGHEADPLGRVATWRAMLVTSLHEANPIGVLEALALGTPAFSAELPGVAEILDGRAGWLMPSRDPARWGESLRRLIVAESRAAADVSRAARDRYAEAFTAKACADRMAELYRAVLAR